MILCRRLWNIRNIFIAAILLTAIVSVSFIMRSTLTGRPPSTLATKQEVQISTQKAQRQGVRKRNTCFGKPWHQYSNLLLSHPDHVPSSKFIDRYPPQARKGKDAAKISRKKMVLLWTGIFFDKTYLKNEEFVNCPVSACEVTTSKTLLRESDLVLFHPRNLLDDVLPRARWPHQRWALISCEPPYLNGMNMTKYGDVFNWTITYRSDSDFVLSFGNVFPTSFKSSVRENLYRDVTAKIKGMSKLVFARISNCHALNGRLEYVRELQKLLPGRVDFYGFCGNKKCRGHCSNSGEKVNGYKFHLAFENSMCRDYITEKFWTSLSVWKSVPIVMGGSGPRDYELVAPPRSYIHVDDFTSVNALADYLILLDGNETLYMQYHEWRRDYYVLDKGLTDHFSLYAIPKNPVWCQLCAALHNTSTPSQTYRDLSGWYLQDSCAYFDERYYCPKMGNCCWRNVTTGASGIYGQS